MGQERLDRSRDSVVQRAAVSPDEMLDLQIDRAGRVIASSAKVSTKGEDGPSNRGCIPDLRGGSGVDVAAVETCHDGRRAVNEALICETETSVHPSDAAHSRIFGDQPCQLFSLGSAPRIVDREARIHQRRRDLTLKGSAVTREAERTRDVHGEGSYLSGTAHDPAPNAGK
jgi:hypothetical protein